MRRTGFAVKHRPLVVIGSLLGASASVSAGLTGTPPDHGFQWAVIGAPGNRPTNPEEVPNNDHLRLGAVDHTFRLSKTETSGAQWLEFVQAYAPHVGDAFNRIEFTGGAIHFNGFDPNGIPTYVLAAGYDAQQAVLGWRYAARYANWLHNDKAMTREAFESGAYDTNSFGVLPDGTLTDQAAHSPNAKFWIPTLDEWIKAAYYDPAKDGGAGGYWLHPGQSDIPLISGRPGDPGAQTGAGVSEFPYPYGIALYPALGPWGLYDMSGGVNEWTETLDSLAMERFGKGTSTGQGWGYEFGDRIDRVSSTTPDRLLGFRLASVVPSPGTLLAGFCATMFLNFRRGTR